MRQIQQHFQKLNGMFANNKEEFLRLIPKCEQFNSDQIRIIYKALYKASYLHLNQKRKSGEDYIVHPIGAASILANFGLDFQTVSAALLHDTIEDTSYTLAQCEQDFGQTITKIVDGVTKIGNGSEQQTHNKILLSSQEEPRIIAVKIGGDKMHNMYTLDALERKKQIRFATDTMNFDVPITKILGIYQLKDELQDLCLYYLDKEEFLKLEQLRNKLKELYNKYLDKIGTKTQDILSENGIAMDFNYRIKNSGGIYEDLKKGIKLNQIDDLLAIKMVLSEYLMCYQALGAIHQFCTPEDEGVLDFIALPKNNGYKSLNTNVFYKNIKVQARIRTKEMQKTNNLGVFSDLNQDVKERLSDDMRKELTKLSKKRKGEN